MSAQRMAALGGLVLVAALVIGLVATNGDDDSIDADATAEPTSDPVDTDGDTATGTDTRDDTATAPPGAANDPDTTSTAGTDAADPTDPMDPTGNASPTESAGATDPVDPADTALDDPNVPELPDRGPHLPLLQIDGWLQSDVESLEELRGKVVAVQFWTFGCANCRNTMQQNAALYEKYGGDDFEIVGIHAPEFDFERDPDRILESAAEQDITWPIVLDTEKRTFHSWQEGRRGFWPRVYLLDRDGNVRYDRIGEYGESGFEELDAAVGALIAGA